MSNKIDYAKQVFGKKPGNDDCGCSERQAWKDRKSRKAMLDKQSS